MPAEEDRGAPKICAPPKVDSQEESAPPLGFTLGGCLFGKCPHTLGHTLGHNSH